MTAVLLFGALAGSGVLILVLELGGGPARSPAGELARMDAARARSQSQTSLTVDRRHTSEATSLRRIGSALRSGLEAQGIVLPPGVRGDLALTGRSLEAHLGLSLLGAVVGALAPILIIAVLAVFIPAVGALAIGGALLAGLLLGAVMPTLTLMPRARNRRRDFRHVVGSFLDLVSMNLAGGRGVPEALHSACRISDGWAMVRIRDALEMARLQGATPWATLGQLGADMRIDELRDLAAALALVADDGAKIRDSLAARAESLRRRELAEVEGRAQARSQSMLIAQLLLAAGFLVFLTYPALARIMG
jgi:tight adherence protein C